MAQDVMRSERQMAPRMDGGEATRARPVYRPLTDIYETEDSIVLTAEMPGVTPDGVDVTLERQVLAVRGEAPAQVHEGYRQVYGEYRDGDYERAFVLSEEIDRERIKATHADGVLTLVLPKAERAKAKQIKVQGA